MGKLIIVSESQLKKIIEGIAEDEKTNLGLASQVMHNDKTTDVSTFDKDMAKPVGGERSFEAYLQAFDQFVKDTGICTLNEEELNEGILDDLKNTLKKGVLIASAAVALGIVTPQEAQAQIGHKPNKEYVKMFGDRAKKQCKAVGVKKKTQSDRQTPSKGVMIYKSKYIAPKFDDGESRGAADKYFVMDKDGDYKQISLKQLEKIKKKHNISTKEIKGKELKKAIQQNR